MNIVTGGCSFSNTEDCVDYTRFKMEHDSYQLDNYKSWALHLEDIIPDSKVYNRALPGIGNGHIVRSIIWQVNELLKQNIKKEIIGEIIGLLQSPAKRIISALLNNAEQKGGTAE